jgi:predicted glycosyltransferase
VDEIMIEKAWMLKSRNVAEIAEYVKNAQKQNERTTRSKQVQKQVLGILDDIISQVK